jgi:hypothetical protein
MDRLGIPVGGQGLELEIKSAKAVYMHLAMRI